MTLRYLLDTDIFIFIRRRRSARLLDRFASLESGAAAISAISYGELLYGAEKSGRRDAALQGIHELAAVIPILPLPVSAASIYGERRLRLERRGLMIGNNDLWIAAHALATDLTLVTNNEREFRRIDGLRVENWAG